LRAVLLEHTWGTATEVLIQGIRLVWLSVDTDVEEPCLAHCWCVVDSLAEVRISM
jgi:hypothetical protein